MGLGGTRGRVGRKTALHPLRPPDRYRSGEHCVLYAFWGQAAFTRNKRKTTTATDSSIERLHSESQDGSAKRLERGHNVSGATETC